jgi:tetratricopeptide (TPR) repeat protein
MRHTRLSLSNASFRIIRMRFPRQDRLRALCVFLCAFVSESLARRERTEHKGTKKSTKVTKGAVCAVVSMFAFAAGSPALAQGSEVERLKACIAKIDTDAAAAYQDALTWMGKGNRPAARQCAALALIEMGQPAQGAARLEELANAADAGGLETRAIYLAQAGNAWIVAKNPEAAIVTLTNAIKLSPNDAALYKDRARASLMLKQWDDAGEDLNSALKLSPGDGEAFRLRALALLKLERYQDAFEDVELALKFAPGDIDAAVLRGDIREAMRKKGLNDPAGLDDTPDVRSPVVVGKQ